LRETTASRSKAPSCQPSIRIVSRFASVCPSASIRVLSRPWCAGTPGGTGPSEEPDAAVSTADSTGPDAAGPPDARPAQARLEVYSDSAYGSGEARAAYRDAGHDTVIKPGRCARTCPAGSSTTSPSTSKPAP
jgi:hypothetical protein